MLRKLRFSLTCLSLILWASLAYGRTWSDSTGQFKVEADLIAQNAERVVLKTKKDKLISLDIKQLSEEDQKYLASAEASADRLADADKNHVWQLNIKELKLIGKLAGYYGEDYIVERSMSRPMVNGKKEKDLPEMFVKVLPAIVNHFEKANITDNESLNAWLAKQGKAQHKYHVDGVLLTLASGVEVKVPIFLFGSKEQEFLSPGLDRWRAIQDEKLESEKKAELERRERMMMEASARAYQANQAIQTKAQLIQLELLAVASGATDLWEVELIPTARSGYPFTVVVPARNSGAAQQAALQKYPGTRVGPTRKFAGY